MNPGETIELTVEPEEAGERLDRWLTNRLGDEASRSLVRKWLDGGAIRVRAEDAEPRTAKLKASGQIKSGEQYVITVPPPVVPDLTPRDLDLRVLYEDADLAVIVKPPNLAVHPGPGDDGLTLLNGLLYLWNDLPAGSGGDSSEPAAEVVRPGIVHRLDKLTEGLLLVARNEKAHRKLSAEFKERTIKKEYLAWLAAAPRETQGEIRLPIERHPVERLKMRVAPEGRGRDAITHFEIIQSIASRKGRKFNLARIRIETGRTHQIRLHMSHIGAPVVGDPLYSRSANRFEKFGMLLLARRLAFTHPETGREMEFELEPPKRFLEFERICGNL